MPRPVIAVITDNEQLWQELFVVLYRMGASLWRLPRGDYRFAFAKVRMCAGPYPSAPVLCILDDDVEGIGNVYHVAKQIRNGNPIIRVKVLTKESRNVVASRATIGTGIEVETKGRPMLNRVTSEVMDLLKTYKATDVDDEAEDLPPGWEPQRS